MNIMRSLLVSLAVLTILGCSNSGSPTEPAIANATMKLRFSETNTVGSTPITFTDINDSRCPSSVTCVWAGDAAVRLDSGAETLVLHSNGSAGAVSGRLGTVTIALVDVKPDPVTPDGLKKSDYVITIRVSK